jgi:hypothetical protein
VGTKSANKIRHKETKEKGTMIGHWTKNKCCEVEKNWKVLEGWIGFVWSVGGLLMDSSLVLFVVRVAWKGLDFF